MDYASRLNGKLVLSKIPKELVRIDEKTGEKYIYVNVSERREVGKYGDTHNITVYTQATGTIYLGNLKPWTPRDAAQAPSAVPTLGDDPDMPF